MRLPEANIGPGSTWETAKLCPMPKEVYAKNQNEMGKGKGPEIWEHLFFKEGT